MWSRTAAPSGPGASFSARARRQPAPPLSATTVQLLKVASEIVGGHERLAERLGIGAATLAKFMADNPPLPDPLLLRAVDIVLADPRYRAPSPCIGHLSRAD